MASVFDVAAYILKQCGEMSAMKLQKLVYYSQAWSLVWDDEPLFAEPIQAWANGPVVPELYRLHAGNFKINADLLKGHGKKSQLNKDQRETIDAVLSHYGKQEAHYLSRLTHMESPWKSARGDLDPTDRSQTVISHADMAEYYGSL